MTVSIPVPQSGPTFRVPRRGGVDRLARVGPLTTAAVYVLGGNRAPDEPVALRAAQEDSDFDVRCSIAATTCTITVVGEVDSLTAPFLRECLLDLLDRPDPGGDVVVDLSQVTFLSAAGLTALAIAYRTACSAGRVLRIRCGTARAVLRPLEITGLRSVFTIIE